MLTEGQRKNIEAKVRSRGWTVADVQQYEQAVENAIKDAERPLVSRAIIRGLRAIGIVAIVITLPLLYLLLLPFFPLISWSQRRFEHSPLDK